MTVQVAVNLWRSCGLARSHSNQWFNWSFLLDTLMQHAWGIAFSYHLVFCPAPPCVQARLPQSTGGGRVLPKHVSVGECSESLGSGPSAGDAMVMALCPAGLCSSAEMNVELVRNIRSCLRYDRQTCVWCLRRSITGRCLFGKGIRGSKGRLATLQVMQPTMQPIANSLNSGAFPCFYSILAL